MKVEIYIEDFNVAGKYNLLDLFQDESLNMEFKLKDLTELDKVYSTYTKEVTIPASAKNNDILGHYFNTDIARVTTKRTIKAKIYINTELFKVGVITVTEGKYKLNKLTNYKISFNTGLTNLKDRIGEDELNTIDMDYLDMIWHPTYIRAKVNNSADHPEICVPLISRSKIWSLKDGNSDQNISTNSNPNSKGFIRIEELRPAIRFKTIMQKVFEKYDLNIDIPWDNDELYNNLYLWCNNKTEQDFYDTQLTINVTPQHYGINTAVYFTATALNNKFRVFYTGTSYPQPRPYEFVIKVVGIKDSYSGANYVGNITLIVKGSNHKNYSVNVEMKENSNGTAEAIISIPQRDVIGGVVDYELFINSSNPLLYNAMSFKFRMTTPFAASGGYTSDGNGATTVVNRFNFKNSVGNIKIIDMITSMIKMFNISIIEDKFSDKLTFLRSKDIRSNEKDYTDYVDITSHTKLSVDVKKELTFTHKESEYFRNIEYKKLVGKEYGSEVYVNPDPYLSGDFEVETDFDVLNYYCVDGGRMVTSYGFETPDNPVNNTDTIVLMVRRAYLDIWDEDHNVVPIYIGDRQHPVYRYVSFGNQSENGDSITFDIDISPQWNEQHLKSLYNEYYDDKIERMYDPNSRLAKYDAYLPPNELNDFNLLDFIIVGDEKFTIEEASIDLTTGKSKLTLFNVTSNMNQYGGLPQPPSYYTALVVDDTTLRFTWGGSFAKYGVKGHIIEYKKAVDTDWIEMGFFPVQNNNESSYVEYLNNLNPNTTYNVRFRTVDMLDQKSIWVGLTVTTSNTGSTDVVNPPTNLEVLESDQSSIKIRWSGATADALIAGYNVAWKTSNSIFWTEIFVSSSSDINDYIINGLSTETDYDIRVRTVDEFQRVSVYINTSGSTTPIMFHQIMIYPIELGTNMFTSLVMGDKIRVGWNAPMDTENGYPLSHFIINWRKVGDTVWNSQTINSLEGSGEYNGGSNYLFYHYIEDLDNNTEYEVKVDKYVSGGIMSSTDTKNFTTGNSPEYNFLTLPTQGLSYLGIQEHYQDNVNYPTALVVNFNNTFEESYDTTTLGYEYYYENINDPTDFGWGVTNKGLPPNFPVRFHSFVTPNTQYYVKMRANGVNGSNLYSDWSPTYTATLLPILYVNPPTDVSFITPDINTLVLNFKSGTSNYPIVKQRIILRNADTNQVIKFINIPADSTSDMYGYSEVISFDGDINTSISIISIVEGSTGVDTFEVLSEPSTPLIYNAPTWFIEPVDFNMTIVDGLTLNLDWVQPETDQIIDHYLIEYSSNPINFGWESFTTTSTNYTLSTIPNKTNYVKLTAVSTINNRKSEANEKSILMPDVAYTIEAPTMFEFEQVGNNEVKFKWSGATSTFPITQYQLRVMTYNYEGILGYEWGVITYGNPNGLIVVSDGDDINTIYETTLFLSTTHIEQLTGNSYQPTVELMIYDQYSHRDDFKYNDVYLLEEEIVLDGKATNVTLNNVNNRAIINFNGVTNTNTEGITHYEIIFGGVKWNDLIYPDLGYIQKVELNSTGEYLYNSGTKISLSRLTDNWNIAIRAVGENQNEYGEYVYYNLGEVTSVDYTLTAINKNSLRVRWERNMWDNNPPLHILANEYLLRYRKEGDTVWNEMIVPLSDGVQQEYGILLFNKFIITEPSTKYETILIGKYDIVSSPPNQKSITMPS